MRRSRSVAKSTGVLAALAVALSATAAFAHGGAYQPPPPEPRGSVPPDIPRAGGPTTGGGGGPTKGPVTGGGDTGGPTTGGGGPIGPPGTGGGPTTGGPTTGGPTTGGGPGAGGGPTTGGGGPLTGGQGPGGLPTITRGAAGRPVSAEISDQNWTNWWYANRMEIIEWKARALEQARDLTPGREDASDVMFRAEARAHLSSALAHDDEDISSGAAIALGKDGDPASAPALIGVLNDGRRQQPVREAAALALGLLRVESGPGAETARRALTAVATNTRESDRLRAMTLYALGLRREMASAPVLLDVASRAAATWDVPAAAVSSLGIGGHDLLVPELIEYLEGSPGSRRSDPVRRIYAAHALARAGATEALPALRDAARDRDADVRRAAVLALGAIGTPDDDATHDALIRVLLRDKADDVQHAAALSLGRVGHDRAARALTRAFEKGDTAMVPYAALGLGLLARRPGHEDAALPVARAFAARSNAELRGPLAVACGIARESRAAPALREVVADGDVVLRGHAAIALGLIGDAESIPVLRTVLEEEHDPALRRECALALGMLGDVQAVRILREILEDGGSVYVAGSAAVALGHIGGNSSGRLLLDLMKDERRPNLARGMAAVGLGLMLDESQGRRLSAIGADLDWYLRTSAVHEVMTIL